MAATIFPADGCCSPDCRGSFLRPGDYRPSVRFILLNHKGRAASIHCRTTASPVEERHSKSFRRAPVRLRSLLEQTFHPNGRHEFRPYSRISPLRVDGARQFPGYREEGRREAGPLLQSEAALTSSAELQRL
jgi:hypothetical protein